MVETPWPNPEVHQFFTACGIENSSKFELFRYEECFNPQHRHSFDDCVKAWRLCAALRHAAPTRFLVILKVTHLVNDYMVEAPKTSPRALKSVEMAGFVPDRHFDDWTPKNTPGSYLAWRERDGFHTRMEKLGDGGVVFCSYYAELRQECEIWLLGSVQSPGQYPLVLRSSRGDGLAPFTLDWNSESGTNLGYLNKEFVAARGSATGFRTYVYTLHDCCGVTQHCGPSPFSSLSWIRSSFCRGLLNRRRSVLVRHMQRPGD